ncbi:STAS domain-containing protein [Virgisporangium aurantiacum]|uniref:STAS domain-containing protein n=1 Tax=Virgisporangium aurantiacum TaxID=175570 RepID=UPI00357116B8
MVGVGVPDERTVPSGPLRDLVLALHDLYRDAGMPGTRWISHQVNRRDDLPDTLSHEGVSALLRGTGRPRWAKVESLVRVLVARSVRGRDTTTEVANIHALWLRVADTDTERLGVPRLAEQLYRIGVAVPGPADYPFSAAVSAGDDESGCRTISVSGELDISCVAEFRHALQEVAPAESMRCVLDLCGVRFLESTALGVIVGFRQLVYRLGGTLSVICSPPVYRIMNTVGVVEFLQATEPHPAVPQSRAPLGTGNQAYSA